MLHSHGPHRGWVTTMTHAQMCDTDLSRCYCGAGFPEHRLVWCQGCTLSLSQVQHSHGPQRGWVTTMTHAQMCDRTDLRRCYCGAGFSEHRLVWSQGCTLSLSQVQHSHGPHRGWVTTMTHAQMCDIDLRRRYCGAGFPEHRLVWSQGCTLSLSQV